MTTAFLNVSGAQDDDGVGAEATTVFETVEARAGELAGLVRLRLLYTDRAHFAPLHAVRQPFFTQRLAVDDYPAMTGVITGGRGEGHPLLDAQATVGPAKQAVFAPEVWRSVRGQTAPLPVSHGTAHAGLLFVSGQVAYDGDAQVRGATVVEQLDTAFANLDAILRAAGARASGIAAFTVYIVEAAFSDHDAAVDHFTRLAAARCGDQPPVVTWVGVKELFQPGLLVEVEAAVSLGEPVRRSAVAAPRSGLPPSAIATRTGAWCFAGAAAEMASPSSEHAGRAVAEALASVRSALAVLELDQTTLKSVTAWCPPGALGPSVVAAVRSALPGAEVMDVPLALPGAAPARVVLEAVGLTDG